MIAGFFPLTNLNVLFENTLKKYSIFKFSFKKLVEFPGMNKDLL